MRTMKSKPQSGLPIQENQNRERCPNCIGCEKHQICCLPERERQLEMLKGETHKISCAAIHLGLQLRKGTVDWSCVRRIQGWEAATLVSLPQAVEVIFLQQTCKILPGMGGKQLPHPVGKSLFPACGIYALILVDSLRLIKNKQQTINRGRSLEVLRLCLISFWAPG